MYVVFTSGSIGVPKDVQMLHSNIASAFFHQRESVGFDTFSRVLDSALHVFDLSCFNALFTFASGSCLCIPSTDDFTNNMAQTITFFQVTHTFLTPSMARLLKPDTVSTLQCLFLGREPLKARDFATWHKSVCLKNLHDPPECTPATTSFDMTDSKLVVAIGKPLGTNACTVDEEGTSLADVGTVGELWQFVAVS